MQPTLLDTPLSVSHTCALLEELVSASGVLLVEGEISGFVCSRAGHNYFTLKDATASLRCVLFAGSAKYTAQLAEGSKVIVRARASIYAKTGALQLVVEQVRTEQTQGALYAQFVQLKEQLGKEGLFDQAHKQPLPDYPETVGVITSATGAVRRDIETTLARRFPCAHIVIFAAQVQGDGAVASLCRALDRAERYTPHIECAIIGRGGGSIEDLAAFNDEQLIRRLHAFTVPIVSAVGHQTDVTLCDFVADMRAATPTAAAELLSPAQDELLLWIDAQQKSMKRRAHDKLVSAMHGCTMLATRLGQAQSAIVQHQHTIDTYLHLLRKPVDKALSKARLCTALIEEKLRSHNPRTLFARGFAYAVSNSKAISSVRQLTVQQAFTLQMHDGKVGATVVDVEPADE